VTTIGIVLYDRFTALDAVGPYEVLCRLPGSTVRWIAADRNPVRSDRSLVLVPDATFDDAPRLDVVLVPGGPGQFDVMNDERLLGFIRRAADGARYVTSVCTGSLLLAQAGLLTGKKATTHWLAMDVLPTLGAEPVRERLVRDGNVWTAAGVSSGIDLALALAAELSDERTAQAIQLGIEYDPKPPFDAGAPGKAPADVEQMLRENARAFLL
jgi:transcriptional regulator GlxA family with amidase domain